MSLYTVLMNHRSEIRVGWLEQLLADSELGSIGEVVLGDLIDELFRHIALAPEDTDGDALARRAISFSRRAYSHNLDGRQTAALILQLKRPLFNVLDEAEADSERLWEVLEFVDGLALEVLSRRIEYLNDLAEAQRQEVLQLSTPVVHLWDGVLLMPLIGTMDSVRSAAALETLLEGVEESGAEVAILDISGVPTVDAEVGRRLIRAASAVRLMGAEMYISGVSPRIASTIVTLGVDLSEVKTTSTLARGLRRALERLGLQVMRVAAQ